MWQMWWRLAELSISSNFPEEVSEWVVGVWQRDFQIWLQLRRRHRGKQWTPRLRFSGWTTWSSTDTKTQPIQQSRATWGRVSFYKGHIDSSHTDHIHLGGPTVLFFSTDSINLPCAGSRFTCQLFLWPEVQSPVQEKIEYNGDRSSSKRFK